MLVLMGSGETSPTMVELHKRLVRQTRSVGGVVVLDTPYGFQENADELSAKIVTYFADRVGTTASVASLRSADVDSAQLASAGRALAGSGYVFSGPGSPTYALEHWRRLGLVEQLRAVLQRGGVVTLASAASVTAGRWSLPVYEIYKAGLPPHWAQGLDLLGSLGVSAAVVPHFDNKEGGTHDTSCCYVGRRRLDQLRTAAHVPLVIGVDEHTSLAIDPTTLVAQVGGQGRVTLLTSHDEEVFGSGESFSLAGRAVPDVGPGPVPVDERATEPRPASLAADLSSAIDDRDAGEVSHLLHQLVLGAASPAERLGLGAVLTRLTPLLEKGFEDGSPAESKLLTGLVAVRQAARETKQWMLADLVRDLLSEGGWVVVDTPAGPELSSSMNSVAGGHR